MTWHYRQRVAVVAFEPEGKGAESDQGMLGKVTVGGASMSVSMPIAWADDEEMATPAQAMFDKESPLRQVVAEGGLVSGAHAVWNPVSFAT